jgi:hypothetical protein
MRLVVSNDNENIASHDQLDEWLGDACIADLCAMPEGVETQRTASQMVLRIWTAVPRANAASELWLSASRQPGLSQRTKSFPCSMKLRERVVITELQHQRRLRIEIERLAGLEEELAHASRAATAGDAEASLERATLLDEVAAQKRVIAKLQNVEGVL